MPFTPFHFGPGAAIHSAAPQRISFIAFCAANVLIDVEPLVYMVTDDPPLHRFFHTYVGALIVAAGTLVLFLLAKRIARRLPLPDVLGWRGLEWPAVAAGALLGTLTHIALDSIMHADIRPLAPFSQANALYALVPIGPLQWACVAAGILGAAVLGVRALLAKRRSSGRG